jgi:hypothetical protein
LESSHLPLQANFSFSIFILLNNYLQTKIIISDIKKILYRIAGNPGNPETLPEPEFSVAFSKPISYNRKAKNLLLAMIVGNHI